MGSEARRTLARACLLALASGLGFGLALWPGIGPATDPPLGTVALAVLCHDGKCAVKGMTEDSTGKGQFEGAFVCSEATAGPEGVRLVCERKTGHKEPGAVLAEQEGR